MALTEKKIGEMAMLILQEKLEEDGQLRLSPHEIKHEIKNFAKKLNLPKDELTEFVKIVMKNAFDKTNVKLNKIIKNTGKPVKKKF